MKRKNPTLDLSELEKYYGKWVLMYDGKILEHSRTLKGLEKKAHKWAKMPKYRDKLVYWMVSDFSVPWYYLAAT